MEQYPTKSETKIGKSYSKPALVRIGAEESDGMGPNGAKFPIAGETQAVDPNAPAPPATGS